MNPQSQAANSSLVEIGNGQCTEETEPLVDKENNVQEDKKKNRNYGLSSCFKRDKYDAEIDLQNVQPEKGEEVLGDKTETDIPAEEIMESNDIKNKEIGMSETQ